MNLQQASQYLEISKKRLWRAVKSGQLQASRVQRGARWEYRVTEEELQSYRRKYLDSLEMKAVGWSTPERDGTIEEATQTSETERETGFDGGSHQVVLQQLTEAKLEIVDLKSRLKAAERNRHETWQKMADLSRREQELSEAAGMLHKALGIMQVRA